MLLSAEISLYPAAEDYVAPIDAFIARLNTYPGVRVRTYPTATVVVGEYDEVMRILAIELRTHCERHGMGVFVTKLIPGYDASHPEG